MDLKGGWIKVQNVFAKNDKEIIRVKFNTMDEIKKFVNLTENLNGDILVYSGHYVVDGRSLMGILSLALSSPVDVRVIDEEERKWFTDCMKEMKILVEKGNW